MSYTKTAGEILAKNQQLEREILLLIEKFQREVGFNPEVSIFMNSSKENGTFWYDIKVKVSICA